MILLLHMHSACWAAYLIISLFRFRTLALINPLFHYGLAQIVYFSNPPLTGVGLVFGVQALASIFIAIGYWYVTQGLSQHIREQQPRELVFDQYPVQLFVMIAAIAIVALVPVMALAQGISLFKILTSFYTMEGLPEVHPIFRFIHTAFSRVPMIVIIIGRIWFFTTRHRVIRQLWFILYSLQMILVVASGIRSGVLFMLLFPLLADVFVTQVLRVQLTLIDRLRKRTAYTILFALVLIAIPFLTMFRGQKFRSFEEISRAVMEVFEFEEYSAAVEQSGHQSINDMLAFTVRHYSQRPQYLRGVYAQVVNPIPRYFWPNKPVGFGKVLAHDMLGAPYHHPLSLAAGVSGEAFYNGGWPGVAFFSCLFGMFFGALYRALWRFRDIAVIASVILFIAWTTGITRGDWLSSLNLITYQAITFMIAVKVLRFFLGQPIVVEWLSASIPVTPEEGEEYAYA